MVEAVLHVAREFDVVKVKLTKQGAERVARLQAENKCLGCERDLIDDERVTCGQCTTCYNAAIVAIGKRRFSRTELIREGKMLAPTKGGRPPGNPFTKEMTGR